jgi:predicted DNA-binding protein with PD1-like motif
MKHQTLGEPRNTRRFLAVFDTDDEVMVGLAAWAQQQRITAGSFSGIGAFRKVTLGYFDVDRREYAEIVVDEQVEVLSLAGNIAEAPDGIKVHAHVVLGKRDGTAHGGHLLAAYVRPTLELIVVETSVALRRTIDRATGLPLLDPER